jgi:hypothetical protein
MEKFNSELTRKATIKDIAENLIKAADRIYRYYIGIALGQEPPEGFEQGNKDYQTQILAQVGPMLKDYQQTQKINADSSGAVIDLLKNGKVTPRDAIDLLKVISTKLSVEEDEMQHKIKRELMEEIEKEATD